MRRPAGLRSSVPPRALVALACSIAAACGPAGASDTSGRAETSAGECEPGTVRGPAPRTAAPLVRHATGFTLSRPGDHTVLEVHPPADRGGGRDVMVLIRCDRAAPALEGSLEAAHVVRVPVRTAAANEDLSLTRLRVLGRTESITAMGSGGVYDPALRALWESGAAVEIGASFHGPPRFEALLAVQPGITFLSSASLGEAASLRRARELGLRAAPSLSWVESSLLGQAEWLIYVAAFLGEEERAREHLDRVEARYRGLSETARAEGARPLVLWIEPSGAGDR